MQDFYWLKKTPKDLVPHILGLTASPIIGSNLSGLETLESILDATCRSPRKQKIDLSLHARPPVMVQIPFSENGPIAMNPHDSPNMASLIAVYLNLDIHDDPEIINTDASKRKLERALIGKKTFIQN
jgi:hypothetical protein